MGRPEQSDIELAATFAVELVPDPLGWVVGHWWAGSDKHLLWNFCPQLVQLYI